MENKKLKELYDYDMVSDADEDFTVNEWFNVLLEKNVYDLTLTDICRMLRQKIFSVVAIGRAIEILEQDPFSGDLYEGQLMVTLCNAKEKYLCRRYDDIEPLLEKADALYIAHEWQDNEAKKEYIEAVYAFKEKIKNSKLPTGAEL